MLKFPQVFYISHIYNSCPAPHQSEKRTLMMPSYLAETFTRRPSTAILR